VNISDLICWSVLTLKAPNFFLGEKYYDAFDIMESEKNRKGRQPTLLYRCFSDQNMPLYQVKEYQNEI
jgi:hypothetical protein